MKRGNHPGCFFFLVSAGVFSFLVAQRCVGVVCFHFAVVYSLLLPASWVPAQAAQEIPVAAQGLARLTMGFLSPGVCGDVRAVMVNAQGHMCRCWQTLPTSETAIKFLQASAENELSVSTA
jgi:hypothetical protein